MNKNKEIADMFERIADVLEVGGENIFKIKAYRRAARIISDLPENIADISSGGRLGEVEGIGKGMAEKIEEYLATGKIEKYQKILAEIPESVLDLLNIQNLGPKTLFTAYKNLGVKNLEDLEKVIENGQLEKVFGMGDKKIENIKEGIELYKEGRRRVPLGLALPVVNDIIGFLEKTAGKVSAAGSLRRMRETVGDIDILTESSDGRKVIDAFTGHPMVREITAKGETKASVIIAAHNLQVDLRVVKKESYGAALQYFTGSKAHNVKVRGLAKNKGLKINEYGVFRGTEMVAGSREEDVYAALGLAWIPPELREDRGEVEASGTGALPELIKTEDIKGDIHIHSNYSDGLDDIKSIALSAREKGFEYIGICDHSKASKIAGGMDENKLRQRNSEIDKVQEEVRGIKILKGIEVDILADGRLDYSDSILKNLDFVIAAIHQGFSKNAGQRMKKAMENPFVDIIAHPTGRLLSGRKGYDLDIEEIIDYASKNNVALEINSHFDRLDLNDVNILKGKPKGVKFIVSTDLHNIEMFGSLSLGVGMARRGWLEAKDVLNAYSWKEIPLRRYSG